MNFASRLIHKPEVASEKYCLYCGENSKNLSKEHILPRSLGGKKSIRAVCERCNNTVLSYLDEELAVCSPISWIAGKYLRTPPISDMWMIDESSNTLTEGAYDHASDSCFQYSQLIVEGDRVHIRGDGNEIAQLSSTIFQERLMTGLYSAFKEYEKRIPRKLMMEEIKHRHWPNSNRFPPRFFTRERLIDLDAKSKFYLRYTCSQDRRSALNALARLRPGKVFKYSRFEPGSRKGAYQMAFSPEITSRAFLKIGINVLKWLCTSTEISRSTFLFIIPIVTGEVRNIPFLTKNCGFVKASSLCSMEPNRGEHEIWVINGSNIWEIHFSFFGGDVGATVRFPGPCNEDWRWARVRIPYGQSDFEVKTFSFLPNITTSFSQGSMKEIIPSLKLNNPIEGTLVEKRKMRFF